MKMSASVTQFLMDRSFPHTTERWYAQKLSAFTLWLETKGVQNVEDINHHLAIEYLRSLESHESTQFKRPISSKTRHGYARALKAFVRWAQDEEYLQGRIDQKLRMPKVEETLVEVLSKRDITLLLNACSYEPGWLAGRDRTILAVLLDTGVRASELIGLETADVHLGLTESYLVVTGKGRKTREVPVGKQCRSRLHRYLHNVRPQMEAPWAFPSRRFGKLTVQGLDKTLYRLRDYAGLTGRDIRAHVFRHTMAVMFIENGGDVLRLSRILGHSSLAVTQEYLKQFTSRQARSGALSVFDRL